MSIISEARELRAQFVKLRDMATDEMALQTPNLYSAWGESVAYEAGERVLYNGILYRVIQSHTSQADWTPDAAPSLFAKVLIPTDTAIPEWEQPDSTNAYMTGDTVMYEGKTWKSTVDNNVWAPGVYGWVEI